MIICQLIQIIINTKETLSEYYEKVKGGFLDILLIIELDIDFMDHCPICGKSDCPQFIKYYYRQVIDEDGRHYKDFPIARYKCRNEGKTFSLLPYQLIPYSRYSIPFIIKVLELRHKEGLSIYKVLDRIASLGQADILNLAADRFTRFKNLIIEAVNKITSCGYYPEFNEKVKNNRTDKDNVLDFMEFAQDFECLKCEMAIKGACGLDYDFYINGGGYIHNAHFLFGTASQFR